MGDESRIGPQEMSPHRQVNQELASVVEMLFTLRVNSEYMDHKFREAVKLLNDGKYQECIDIWMELVKEVIKEARYLEHSTKLLQGLVNSDE